MDSKNCSSNNPPTKKSLTSTNNHITESKKDRKNSPTSKFKFAEQYDTNKVKEFLKDNSHQFESKIDAEELEDIISPPVLEEEPQNENNGPPQQPKSPKEFQEEQDICNVPEDNLNVEGSHTQHINRYQQHSSFNLGRPKFHNNLKNQNFSTALHQKPTKLNFIDSNDSPTHFESLRFNHTMSKKNLKFGHSKPQL